jgi:hypothetical protein
MRPSHSHDSAIIKQARAIGKAGGPSALSSIAFASNSSPSASMRRTLLMTGQSLHPLKPVSTSIMEPQSLHPASRELHLEPVMA